MALGLPPHRPVAGWSVAGWPGGKERGVEAECGWAELCLVWGWLVVEGGEQGDRLMLALFSLGQRAALNTVQQELHVGENLLAFLDDIYALVPPTGYTSVRAVRNAPTRDRTLGPNVWVGSHTLPAEEQGLMILGTPVGSRQQPVQATPTCTTAHPRGPVSQPHPEKEDLQASWLLLLYCASPPVQAILAQV